MRRTILATVAVGLVLGACGGGGDGTTVSEGVVTTGGRTSTTSTTTNDGTTGETAGGEGSLTGVFGSTDRQQAALTMGQAMTAAVSGSGTAANFDEAGKMLRAAEDAAPAEIKADVATLADAFADLYDRIGDVAYDPKTGQMPPKEYLSAFEVFNDAKYQKASENVSSWFASNCGIKN